MRLVCVLFTFENNTGHTDGRMDGRTDGRTDTPSYRDVTAHLKIRKNEEGRKNKERTSGVTRKQVHIMDGWMRVDKNRRNEVEHYDEHDLERIFGL